MRIAKMLAFAGPNIWSRRPTLEVVLQPGVEAPGAEYALHSRREQLLDWYNATSAELPTMAVDRSRFVQRLEQAHHDIDLFAAVVQELQTLAGTPVAQSRVETAGPWLQARVAFEFAEEPIARLAVDMAARLVWATHAAPIPDFVDCLRDLQKCAEQSCFGGTTGPIVEAARRRGIPVVRLDGDCLVQLGHGAQQHRIMGSNTSRTGFLAESISRDKSLTKQLLEQLGIPVPPGRLVADAEDAWAAACELGLPVVVKPRDEDCGMGVSLMLKTRAQVALAYARARDCRPDVIVERHLPGAAHRLFVVNDRLVSAVRRDAAQVAGNGSQTVAEIVAEANRDPRRGDGSEFPWFPIVVDDEAVQILADQQLSLNSIPLPGQVVSLRYDPKTCFGGTILEVTDRVHPETAAAVRDAVRVTGLDVAGVDVMASDIALPLAEQQGGILEVNGGPAIYLHRSPFCEPGRPVAEAVVESLIPAGDSGLIPIVTVVGDDPVTGIAATIARLLQETGQIIGLATQEGVRVGPHWRKPGRADDAHGCRSLLLHPRVELAVSAISWTSLREDGLAFDECQVAVLAAGPKEEQTPAEAAITAKCLRIVSECVSGSGAVIVNVDDPWLAGLFAPGDERLIAVSCDPNHQFLTRHRQCGGMTASGDQAGAEIASGGQNVARQSLPEATIDESRMSLLLAVAAEWAFSQSSGQAVPDVWSSGFRVRGLRATDRMSRHTWQESTPEKISARNIDTVPPEPRDAPSRGSIT